MAGVGPAPKDPAFRARRNRDSGLLKVVEVEPEGQPALEELLGPTNPASGEPWTFPTLGLWSALGEFPTTAGLLRAQWAVLTGAMILYDLVVCGEVKHSAECRLQLAKYGIAPDDLARLRYQLVQADEAEARSKPKIKSARELYGGLGSA